MQNINDVTHTSVYIQCTLKIPDYSNNFFNKFWASIFPPHHKAGSLIRLVLIAGLLVSLDQSFNDRSTGLIKLSHSSSTLAIAYIGPT